MERIEDRSKALSYIGIEVADALKVIPKPVDSILEQPVVQEENVKEAKVSQIVEEVKEEKQELQQEQVKEQIQEYQDSISFEEKPSLWQRFKNSKLVRAVTYVFKIRIRIELPNALPEGRGEK